MLFYFYQEKPKMFTVNSEILYYRQCTAHLQTLPSMNTDFSDCFPTLHLFTLFQPDCHLRWNMPDGLSPQASVPGVPWLGMFSSLTLQGSLSHLSVFLNDASSLLPRPSNYNVNFILELFLLPASFLYIVLFF